jgi:hypothetical protein
MNKEEIKNIVADMLSERLSPSEIQKQLAEKKDIRITFLDLKLIISEIKNSAETLDKNDTRNRKNDIPPAKEDNRAEVHSEKEQTVDAEIMDEGATVVEMEKLLKPGAVLCGKVKFASGAKADWSVDHYGRLSFANSAGKPSPQDLKLFQAELQRKISG